MLTLLQEKKNRIVLSYYKYVEIIRATSQPQSKTRQKHYVEKAHSWMHGDNGDNNDGASCCCK